MDLHNRGPANMNALLTGAQVALWCGITRQAVYGWVRNGDLKPATGNDIPPGRKLYRLGDALDVHAAKLFANNRPVAVV